MPDRPFPSGSEIYPSSDHQSWVPDRSGIDHNVAVIGGGQNGAAFAFALERARIGKVTVIDAAPDESRAGVWLTKARMRRLRTPKGVPGPDLGLRELSFQSWYEAQYGAEAYDVFDRISRTDWADYLKWFRDTLSIAIRYGVRLVKIEPAEGHFRLHLETDGKPSVETARKIIIANGVAGSGGAYVPPLLAALPASHVAHTSAPIDFERLAGRNVAIVGAAASAFDAAAVALESGAREVHLFARRQHIPATPLIRNRFYPGAYENYWSLPDAVRWGQGHPVVVQAGSSEPGKELAARTAEAIFTAQQTLEEAVAFYADVKGRLAKYGREAEDLKILPGVSPVVGRTESEAREKFEELQGLIEPKVGLDLVATHLGGDLTGYPVDGPVPELPETNFSKSRQALVFELARRENLTIRDLYLRISGARGHWQLVGSPEQIADQLEERFVNYGADGFNLMPPLVPDGLDDFIELVVPELRRRGLFRTEYEGSTLRENLGLKRPPNRHLAGAQAAE